jgi:hypothetical protein
MEVVGLALGVLAKYLWRKASPATKQTPIVWHGSTDDDYSLLQDDGTPTTESDGQPMNPPHTSTDATLGD